MTSKQGDKRMVELGGDPIRISTLQDPEFVEKFSKYPVVAEPLWFFFFPCSTTTTTSSRAANSICIPSRLELDPSHSPGPTTRCEGTLGVVGRGSGMEQVKTQLGWYTSPIRSSSARRRVIASGPNRSWKASRRPYRIGGVITSLAESPEAPNPATGGKPTPIQAIVYRPS